MANIRILVLVSTIFGYSAAQDCAWDKDTDFPTNYPPLLIDEASWISLKPVMDNGQRIVKETEGASVVVACSGTVITNLGVEVAEGVCEEGQYLNIGGTQYTILDLACTSRIEDATLDGLGACGNNNIGQLTHLGFNVPGYQFYPIIQLCFEPVNQITLYAQHIVYGESVSASDGNPDRPSFQDDDNLYPTINPNDCYLTANQDAYATEITGNADLIDLDTDIYFARGHLAPNADFLIEMEADATFYYSNAMPQWQPYNAANWAYVEGSGRDLAESHVVNLQITTGPLNVVMTVNAVNGSTLDVYICDDQNQHIIPTPQAIWKVIYDPVLDQAAAIITSNIPNQVTAPTPVCSTLDCLSTFTWLSSSSSFDPLDFDKGYTYCCSVQDFFAANPNAPDYPTAGLLVS